MRGVVGGDGGGLRSSLASRICNSEGGDNGLALRLGARLEVQARHVKRSVGAGIVADAAFADCPLVGQVAAARRRLGNAAQVRRTWAFAIECQHVGGSRNTGNGRRRLAHRHSSIG